MRILDRQRYLAFFKAYIICFVALVGLYIVIDAFSNFDEFSKRADGVVEIFQIMGQFYLVRMTSMYDRLCGVIGMMAAIFTVTWMQKNNELLAMLAAGISTQRVIRPVWIATLMVSGLAVLNQELIMPRFADELLKDHDDDGVRKVRVSGRYDSNGILIHGGDADRNARTVYQFNATVPVPVFGALRELEAKQGRYIPEDDHKAPLKVGWLLRGAQLNPPVEREALRDNPILVRLDSLAGFPPPTGDMPDLGGESYFLRTDMKFDAVTRKRQWFQLAQTFELMRGLTDPANAPERMEIAVFLHTRIVRPLSSLSLMMLSLPLVLGGYGRNMFINLGLSLGTSATFYGMAFMTQYLGNNGALSPELAAWSPLILFGTLAVARWDTIRT
jgi:lipopolysaccharide export system permease protein